MEFKEQLAKKARETEHRNKESKNEKNGGREQPEDTGAPDNENEDMMATMPEQIGPPKKGSGTYMVRLLKASEIECRIGNISEKGLSLLLYKDARADQKVLDETFGLFGWKRSHQLIDGNLYCTVEVFDKETGQWVSKQDVGVSGFSEKEKSQASDSFKRACVNWGIGRELYTAPFIWIPARLVNIQKKKDERGKDKYFSYERFTVQSIRYNAGREITGLKIMDQKGQVVFEMGHEEIPHRQDRPQARAAAITEEQVRLFEEELGRTGVLLQTVKDRYQFRDIRELTGDTYRKIMSALARTRSADVA